MNSEDSGLAESTEERAGLKEDDFSIALSKFASNGIKCITNNLKQLIDVKKPDESADEAEKAKSVFDLIEDKVLAVTLESLKGDALDKKK